MNQQDNKKSPRNWKRIGLIIANLLLMGVVSVFLIWIALMWMDIWTDHGNEKTVPNVKGLYFDDARAKLEEAGLTVELSDSVYENNSRPGMVVEQNPKVNTRVKPGRTVYLTINAFSPKTVTVPSLTDMSSRQARSILEGLGIKSISEEMVISEYANLVLGARYNGHRLNAGARIPVNAHIVLEVGDGMPELPDSIAPVDSLAATEQVSFF